MVDALSKRDSGPTEKAIVNAIKCYLEKLPGCYVIKTHGSVYGAGQPDLLGCYRGRTLALEVKRPGERPTKLQRAVLKQWENAGALAAVVTSVNDVKLKLQGEEITCHANTNVVPVVLDAKARAAYRKLERELLVEVNEQIIDAGSAAVLTNKLLQVCNGAVYADTREVVEVHNCKIDAFLELVEGLNGKPALVFYHFQHDLRRLERALTKTGLRVRRLTGPQDETDWNESKIDILLAHPASTAYGLNLQDGGNHVIWFGLNWSLELYEQANKRLHRQGQTEKVIIHHLVVEDSRDEDVMAALKDKGRTQDRLMESLKARIEQVKGEN